MADDEWTDVSFAFAATEIKRQERHARFARSQRRGIRWLVVAGLFLALLNFLVCLAYIFFRLTEHAGMAQHALPL
jgi:hypothetical protein